MKLASNERATELIIMLGDPTPRSFGVGHTSTEGRWAAIRLSNDFNEQSVYLLAKGILFWNNFNSFDEYEVRKFGFSNTEHANTWRNTAIDNASHILNLFFNGERKPQEIRIEENKKFIKTNLHSDSAENKRIAIIAIQYFGGYSYIDEIINCLESNDKDLQKEAAKSLNSITHKRFLFGNKNPEKWRKWRKKK